MPAPTATPTLVPSADDDGDGLTNYEETVKYCTDPYASDSDGDGLPDSDWVERREYAYTVRAVLKIRQPYDVETMNDLYQDVRVTEGPDEAGYALIEAIIYRDTEVVFSASPYPLAELRPELRACTQPGIATNYDSAMQAEVLDIVSTASTDVKVVEPVLKWVDAKTDCYLKYSIPEVYYTYLAADGSVQVRNYSDSLPVEELLRTHYFAASMFSERTHGTCTSIAALKCAMLKAAGLPCRLIQTIHPIYYHEDQAVAYTNNLNRQWDCVFEQAAGTNTLWCNHASMEVYLDGHWIRVDRSLGIYHENESCLNLKILSVADWSEVDFSETWPVDWIHERPYYTLSIEDQKPQH